MPQWLTRYAAWSNTLANQELAVHRDLTSGFSRSIKPQGKPAWQQLQAARAIEFYAGQAIGAVARGVESAGDLRDDSLWKKSK